MLSEIEIHNDQGEQIVLELVDVSDGIAVLDISGLDPVKANIVTSSSATQDGVQYHAASRGERNILLKLGFEPDYSEQSVAEIRRRVYDFFMPKAPVDMIFRALPDYPDLSISGRIESCDAPLFTNDPGATVSILCFNPDFYDAIENTVSGDTVTDNTNMVIEYVGSVETGIEFAMQVDRDLTEFTIYNTSGDGVIQRLDFASPLLDGDLLWISTVPGAKAVKRTRSGIEIPLLYGVSPQSSWIQLTRGDNNFRVQAEGLAIGYAVSFTTKYGGL